MPYTDSSIVSKRIIVTRLICVFWIAAKIISLKLWLADRLFPTVPPFNFLFFPSIIHTILFIVSLASLFLLLLFPSKKLLLAGVFIVEILSCILDQNRWQPWEYQYIFMILAVIINYSSDRNSLSIISFIIISVHSYSGFSKMNAVFSQSVESALSKAGIFHASSSYLHNFLMYHTGFFFGIIELSLGISLLFHRTKKIAAILLILMHLLILLVFGPFGINSQTVIWPWNIAMILILYYLFISKPFVKIHFKLITSSWNKVIIILFGIMPAFNFFGYWDFFLSSSLVSSKPPDMYICFHKNDNTNVLKPFSVVNKNKSICDSNTSIINVRSWSFKEMEIPAYPEVRVYKLIKEQLLKRYPDIDASFIIYTYENGRKVRTELK